MQIVKDQMGRVVHIADRPKRIISLVPSQSELLYDLGLNDEVVGITKFCIHPKDWARGRQRIGGTKNPDIKGIHALQPDLIIGNKEENNKEDIHTLERDFPLWMSDVNSVECAADMIAAVGKIVDRAPEAAYLNSLIQAGMNDIRKLGQGASFYNKKCLYLIWKNPYMAAGSGTFIDDMLEKFGLENVLSNVRYPTLSGEDLHNLAPELVFLSSEPYPFREKHILEIQNILPTAKVVLVDGEMFSWYGSRMIKSIQYLFELNASLSNHFNR